MPPFKRVNSHDRTKVTPKDVERENESIRRQLGVLEREVKELKAIAITTVDAKSFSQTVTAGLNFIRWTDGGSFQTTAYAMADPYIIVSGTQGAQATISERQRNGFYAWCPKAGTIMGVAFEPK